jgi:hypothetical protein
VDASHEDRSYRNTTDVLVDNDTTAFYNPIDILSSVNSEKRIRAWRDQHGHTGRFAKTIESERTDTLPKVDPHREPRKK